MEPAESHFWCYGGYLELLQKDPAWLLVSPSATFCFVITVYSGGKVVMYTCHANQEDDHSSFFDGNNQWSMRLTPSLEPTEGDDQPTVTTLSMKSQSGWQHFKGDFTLINGSKVTHHEILKEAALESERRRSVMLPETVCHLPVQMRRRLPCDRLALLWCYARRLASRNDPRAQRTLLWRLNDDCVQRIQQYLAGVPIPELSFPRCRNTWGAGGGDAKPLCFMERVGQFTMATHVVAVIGDQIIAKSRVTDKGNGLIELTWADNDDAQRSGKPRSGKITIDFARKKFMGDVQFPGEGSIGYMSIA